MPNTFTEQPYAAIPDKNHNVWAPLWTTDQIAKYDSPAGTWTMFDLPTRGTEVRIASLLGRGNDLKMVFAYARSSKVAVMTVRSEADMAAIKAQVATRANSITAPGGASQNSARPKRREAERTSRSRKQKGRPTAPLRILPLRYSGRHMAGLIRPVAPPTGRFSRA